jgi:hypothetical protein
MYEKRILENIYNGNWEDAVYLVISYDVSFKALKAAELDSVYKFDIQHYLVLADLVTKALISEIADCKGYLLDDDVLVRESKETKPCG